MLVELACFLLFSFLSIYFLHDSESPASIRAVTLAFIFFSFNSISIPVQSILYTERHRRNADKCAFRAGYAEQLIGILRIEAEYAYSIKRGGLEPVLDIRKLFLPAHNWLFALVTGLTDYHKRITAAMAHIVPRTQPVPGPDSTGGPGSGSE